MAKTTKQLSGAGKDKFLRGLVAGVSDLPTGAAARVTQALLRTVTEVRVRRDDWDALRRAPIDVKAADAMPSPAPQAPSAAPVPSKHSAQTAFDPYAFSAVAVLTRKGRAALFAALEEIATVEHLLQLAQAQHLALDPALKDVPAIRAALIAAAERRIAERKAAAS